MAITKNIFWTDVRMDIFFKADVTLADDGSFRVGTIEIPKAILGERRSPVQFSLPNDCVVERIDTDILVRKGGEKIAIPIALIEKIPIMANAALSRSLSLVQ